MAATTNAATQQPNSPRGKKGPRPRHVPQRTCIACRQKEAKRAYVRLVRTPEGRAEVDPTGKRNGRGAYLCPRRSCWSRAIDGRVIDHALKIQIDDENRAVLREYARSYFPPDEQN